MGVSITVRVGGVELVGELEDSGTGKALLGRLPLMVRMSRWGDEYYGSLGQALGMEEAADAREEMVVGELAYWPPGNALCLFFGPTPASRGKEPRAASPVNPVGRVSGDWATIKGLGRSVEVTVARAATAK